MIKFYISLVLVICLVLKSGKALNEYEYSEHMKNVYKVGYYQPEQIHITYGAKPSQMIITWTTMDFVNETVVEYGIDYLKNQQLGKAVNFKNKNKDFINRDETVHSVLLSNLIPGQTYKYHCGSPKYGWSPVFYFTAMKPGSDWSPRFAVFGDMGNINAQSMPRLQEETMLGYYDAVLHVGDFGYDMVDDLGRVGDAFMNQIQNIAAYIPYLTCVGNHENAYNFSQYAGRFNMPSSDGVSYGGDSNYFFSINIGPVHVISISTEFYYFLEYGFSQLAVQYAWLENDLKEANKPENRALRPWIIVMGHRPMYCSNTYINDDHIVIHDCNFDDRVRKGLPYIKKFGLEELFYDHGVDLEIWAHEHSYERLWPIYNNTVLNGSIEEPYTNPKGPVHIVTGSAGCKERHSQFGPAEDFTAFRSRDYGYTRLQAFNASHLYWEQVSDDQDGKIIDSIWLIKDKHGSYKDLF